MEGEDQQNTSKHQSTFNKKMCCVFWCREEAMIMVQFNGKKYGCCRKHADFVKTGKIDWVDR
jgi:hypothetical protein